jgi:hypothetical protein
MKIRSIGNLLVLAAVASAIISAPSAASSLLVSTPDGVITLPDISYSGFVSIQYQTGFDGNVIEAVGPVTNNVTGPSAGLQYGTNHTTTGAAAGTTFTPGVSPTISGTFHASAHTDLILTGAQAGGVMEADYNFIVVGPSGTVPVQMLARGSASGASVDALLQLNGPTGTVVTDYLPGGPGSWTENGTYNLTANKIYSVKMLVEGEASAAGSGQGLVLANSYAMVDPKFNVVSTFPIADSYSIVFSPGAVSAVPLPASFPLFAMALIGLALIGYKTAHGRRIPTSA